MKKPTFTFPTYPTKIGNTFRIDFNLIRLLDKRIVSSIIEFSVDLDIHDSTTADEQVRILSGIHKWFNDILDNSIAFCPSNSISHATLEVLENNILMCPDEPYDHLLLMLLVAKINAIGSDVLKVGHAHLTSDLGQGFGNWFEGDPNEMLPSLNDWLGPVTYFNEAWWNRSDGSTLDIAVDNEDEDVSKKPDILINLWDDSEITNKEPAEIIKLNFNPIIVKND